jgi:thiamine pyrophosphate-dependent acetolactate synthase large subunit-like protein
MKWTSLAEGFGVPSVEVKTVQELREALLAALDRPGPSLIDAMLQ